jgi:hypothetical protein
MEYCDADAHATTKDVQFIASGAFAPSSESQACRGVINQFINLTDEFAYLVTQLQQLLKMS